MSFNSTYKIPKDASYVTLRNQNRILYANYVIQQNNVQQGCQIRAELQNGGVADADMIPKLLEGARATTAAERDAEIASDTCVVTIPPIIIINYNTDILTFARRLNTLYGAGTVTPTSGGALTINDKLLGNYEYTSRSGNTTISSFSDSDWFTSTEDTVSSWLIVNGNLTINSGQTVIPTKRKLFTVVYVNGNLTVNGSISMTARGANHSGTGSSGGYTAPVDILLAPGTYSGVTNPQIPATGGAGGASRSTNGSNNGTANSDGGTGGGGSGQRFSQGTAGAGSAGTCFSGGTAGAGCISNIIAGSGEANGGRGGNANIGDNAVSAGGTGNPGGTGTGLPNGPDGLSGTGGTLIIISEGTLSGSGSIVSNGVDGTGTGGQVFGGASGGGSISVFFLTNPASAVTVTANGGSAGQAGAGGNGTARKLALA
jgi:hypothetical protein